MTLRPEREGLSRQRWLARLVFALLGISLALLLAFTSRADGRLLLAAALGLVVVVAATYWFLSRRGLVRWLALALIVLTPLVVIAIFVAAGLLVLTVVLLALLAGVVLAGRAALAPDNRQTPMPEHVVPPPRRPFLIMNPRSGGGKVGRFGLKEKAEALGAEVALLGPGSVDVRTLAEDAVARGADLLGVAGGDGTQALVAGVAAEHGVPFLVVSAGTRNHFALDLGLDRDDPSTCLAALTEDAVELHVDLGTVGGRTFVNNASFGAYATVVQSPAYRDDKRRTTLRILPDLISAHAEPRLTAHADGVVVEQPQAVLVSDNPYGLGDVAGMGRRARLDAGLLGMVAVTVDNAVHAVGLLRGGSDRGLISVAAAEVVVEADTPQIPVAVDGEALVLPTPVRCTVRPRALRVRVPRDRPGVPQHHPRGAGSGSASSRRSPRGGRSGERGRDAPAGGPGSSSWTGRCTTPCTRRPRRPSTTPSPGSPTPPTTRGSGSRSRWG